MRRDLLFVVAAIALTVPRSSWAADRPNILFILTDDHALKAISAYGGPLFKNRRDVRPRGRCDRS